MELVWWLILVVVSALAFVLIYCIVTADGILPPNTFGDPNEFLGEEDECDTY